MRVGNLVISVIAVAWGSAILISALLGGGTQGSASYHTGRVVGLVFAVALLLVGAVARAARSTSHDKGYSVRCRQLSSYGS